MAIIKFSLLPLLLVLCAVLLLQEPSPVMAISPAATPTTSQAAVSYRVANKILYHPPTGNCVLRQHLNQPLLLGSCSQSDKWTYTPQKLLEVKGTYFCLQASSSGGAARLSVICSVSDSQWVETSTANSKSYFSTVADDGSTLCLDVGAGNTLVTNPCVCSGSRSCNPGSQWFEIAVYGTE